MVMITSASCYEWGNPMPQFELPQYCCLVSLQSTHRIYRGHCGEKLIWKWEGRRWDLLCPPLSRMIPYVLWLPQLQSKLPARLDWRFLLPTMWSGYWGLIILFLLSCIDCFFLVFFFKLSCQKEEKRCPLI